MAIATEPNANAVVDEVPRNGTGGGRGRGRGRGWKKKVFDLEEVKVQLLIALPLIVAYVFIYSMTLVSVMFAGHLGELELAGSTLANSWATVTGFGLMVIIHCLMHLIYFFGVNHLVSYLLLGLTNPDSSTMRASHAFYLISRDLPDFELINYFSCQTGLSGALETLCGQAFGAKIYKLLGVYLQTSCQISFIVSIIISIIWLFTENILVLLHQDHDVAKTAALYVKYLIPGLFAFGFVQNYMRYCQAQGITFPLVVFTGIPFGVHFGILYLLVHRMNMGLIGAPLAASVSIWFALVLLILFVLISNKFKKTWKGLTLESFRYVFIILKLAIPSAAMVRSVHFLCIYIYNYKHIYDDLLWS